MVYSLYIYPIYNLSLAAPRARQVAKVLHGADHDVLWLQRDFGIFVANLFDTGQAARAAPAVLRPRAPAGPLLRRQGAPAGLTAAILGAI